MKVELITGATAGLGRALAQRYVEAGHLLVLADRIVRAVDKRKPWLYPDRLSRIGSLLWRLGPGLYLRLIGRQFKGDLH